jgi:hypothetical protein
MADAVNMYPKKYGVKEGEASPISLAIKNSNPKILEAFLLSVLSPPFGERIRVGFPINFLCTEKNENSQSYFL